MKTVTITKELYEYDELSESAKQEAIERLYDINVNYDWWNYDGHTGFTAKELRRMKVKANELKGNGELLTFKKMYFSLDRDYYIQFVDAEFMNDEIARKFLRVPATLWNRVDWNIVDQPGRNGDTRLEYENDYDRETGKDFTPKQIAILDRACEIFNDKISEALTHLSREYDYRTSREAIEDTIRANEYTFTIDGRMDNSR